MTFQWQEKCAAMGCPLKPSAVKEGVQTCSFHLNANVNHWPSITESIKRNRSDIQRYWSAVQKGLYKHSASAEAFDRLIEQILNDASRDQH